MRKSSFRIICINFTLYGLLIGSATSCSDSGAPRIKDAEEVTIYEPTKGVITEVEEVQPGDDFKILDEELVDKKEDSKAIVHYLNGSIDTLSLRTIKEEHTSGVGAHSALRSVLLYSLAGSYFSNRMSGVKPNADYYANKSSFDKSNGLTNDLKSSARSRRISSPKAGAKGYGAGKSFRSYGG